MAALAAHRVGFVVALYERYPEVKASGNILNLWPPPQKILRLTGGVAAFYGAVVELAGGNIGVTSTYRRLAYKECM